MERIKPTETMIDKDGLHYININNLELHPHTFTNNNRKMDLGFRSKFYDFMSTNDYIMKYSPHTSRKILKMVKALALRQKYLSKIEFPIGYIVDNKGVNGYIVPNYQNGITLRQIIDTRDLNILSKYYCHDDDLLHNLFLLYFDIYNDLVKMLDCGIYYKDVHDGNIILDNNEMHLIDFEPSYVKIGFYKADVELLFYILRSVVIFSNYRFKLESNYDLFETSDQYIFKKGLINLENSIRKGL